MSAHGLGLEATKGFKRNSELAKYVRRLLDQEVERRVHIALFYRQDPKR
jgi:hypothetical protein